MKNKIYSVLIVILFYVAVSAFPFNYWVKDADILLFVQAGAKLLSIVFSLLFLHFSKTLDKPKQKFDFLSTFLLIPTCIIIFNNLIYIAIIQAPASTDELSILSIPANISFILATAVAEEIIFRYILLNNIKFKNDLITIIVGGAIFGAFHIVNFLCTFNPFDLLQIVYTTGLGIVLGFFYVYGKGIVFPIIIHALFNLLNSYMYSMYDTPTEGWQFILVAVIDASFVGLYLFLYYKFYVKKVLSLLKNKTE